MPMNVGQKATAAVDKRFDDLRPCMAKASLEKDWRRLVGEAVGRCFDLAGKSQKEVGALVHRDDATISRWVSGEERPQIDAIFSKDELRRWMVVALAELASDCFVTETVIRVRRRV